MSKKLLLALGLFAALVSHAAEPIRERVTPVDDGGWQPPAGTVQVPIWPNGAPDMPDGSRTPEKFFQVKKVPGRHYTGVADVANPTMTIFRPDRKNSDAAIVVFPGGGFQILAIDLEGTEICDWVVSKGVTCILLKYRVPKSNHYWDKETRRHITPEVPFALQDAQRTIRLIRANAAKLSVDPGKIGVIGFSAGGYLVAQTSNIFDDTYHPVDSADSLSSRPDFAIALYPGHLCRSGATFDPTIQVTKRTSPTFLLHAWDDPIDNVCNSTIYANELAKARVPAEVHLFSNGGHGFGLRHSEHGVSSWPFLVESWLRAINMVGPPIPARAGDG